MELECECKHITIHTRTHIHSTQSVITTKHTAPIFLLSMTICIYFEVLVNCKFVYIYGGWFHVNCRNDILTYKIYEL